MNQSRQEPLNMHASNPNAKLQLLGRFQIKPTQQRMGSHGPVRGYNRQDFLAPWAEHFDQPERSMVYRSHKRYRYARRYSASPSDSRYL